MYFYSIVAQTPRALGRETSVWASEWASGLIIGLEQITYFSSIGCLTGLALNNAPRPAARAVCRIIRATAGFVRGCRCGWCSNAGWSRGREFGWMGSRLGNEAIGLTRLRERERPMGRTELVWHGHEHTGRFLGILIFSPVAVYSFRSGTLSRVYV